jgi:hypothetical protein
MKSIFKKSLLLGCLFVLVSQFTFSQKKNKIKNKLKRHHSISISHQGNDADISKGFWNLDEEEHGLSLQLSNRKGSNFSFQKGSFFISFYPNNEELATINNASSQFSIVRAAGTLNFNQAKKTYEFVENKDFKSFLKSEGISDDRTLDFMKLYLGQIDKNYVLGIKNQGYQPTIKQLGKMGILGVDVDYVQNINKTQYKGLELDMLTKFYIHDVTPEYIEGLNDLGYGDMDANMVKKFAIHSISLEYIQGLNEVGYENLDANMIKKFAIHSVSVDYIKGLNNLVYENLEPNDIKNFAVHSISLEYIESLISLEISKPSMSEIKKAKIHGVSANFVERAMRKGHNEKDLSDYVKLKIHGI